MAVDKQLLESCIAEAAGDDQEMVTFLRDRYSKNDALAAKFVGGFTRTQDYTRKTQELADQRKQLDGQSSTLTQQLEATRRALEAADGEKNKVLRELADHRISTAKARELMTMLQEKYQLTDDDLPGMSDLIATAKTGKVVDKTDDLETRLATMRAEMKKEYEGILANTLIPELGSMAALPLVWQEIGREHQELTGKPLTFSEQQEILKTAQTNKQPLRSVWEEKYQISGDNGLRMQKRDERLKQTWQSESEAAAAAKRSQDALNVVAPQKTDLGDGPGISAAFKTKFRQYEMDPNKAATPADGVPTLNVEPGQHVRQSNGNRIPASQRAAAKFLEKGGPAGYARKAS